MPELPEVQTIVDDLNAAGILEVPITGASVFWSRTVAEPKSKLFCNRIKGRKFTAIQRRGKYLVFETDSPYTMLLHLRMSGRLNLVSDGATRNRHEHVVIKFEDRRQLRFQDTRKFGRIHLIDDPQRILGKLGPEPLEKRFTAKVLAERLERHKRLLKPLLLDQTFIAGLGNIYVDEALWDAKLHPNRISATLTRNECQALRRAIPKVLKRGLKNLGTSLGTGKTNFYSVARYRGRNKDELKVFRRTGLPCPRCKATIERIIVGQRSTHICSSCQRI
jgi:formamidopyrimidine-DNA glycosylase